jgi:predicted NAD-dependent protein-ADP-ribosyltransferase YbiA (DUF1768 family)
LISISSSSSKIKMTSGLLKSSYFVENVALFGSYPSQIDVDEFEQMGVRYFVDLTCDGEENIIKYITSENSSHIRYPILDHRIPSNWGSFAKFIVKIGNLIKTLEPNNQLYLHCRGGHGRSGIVVASLLCYILNITAIDGLALTSQYHNNRPEMRDRWRRIGSPQTVSQKMFVIKFFEPMQFRRLFLKEYLSGFGLWSAHQVTIDGVVYKSAGDAILARGGYEREIIRAKFDQNMNIRANLMNTGLRPLIYVDEADVADGWSAWESDGKVSGENRLGVLMGKIRQEFYES